MELKDILKIVLYGGPRNVSWYTHADLEVIIRERFDYNLGRHINAKIIRSIGIPDSVKNVKGVTTRGFWLYIKPLSMQEIENIYLSQQAKHDPHPVDNVDTHILHKKIRFLLRDWDTLPIDIQLDFKKDKERYLKEFVTGSTHNTDWFKKIVRALPIVFYEGTDIDFTLHIARDAIKKLNDDGVIRRSKRPDMDKMHYILTTHGYVRINDFVYGLQHTTKPKDGIPDW
jgi:hypothetical protein